MRRLIVLLGVGAVVAMVMVAYAVPAMAQTPQEVRQAQVLAKMAQERGIAIPSDPEERMRLAAQYGITISPGTAAAMDGGAAKNKSGKQLPKSGGANAGALLGLGAGVALIGGGLVAHRSSTRHRRELGA